MKNEKTKLIIWAVVALVIGVVIGMIITNATTGNATAGLKKDLEFKNKANYISIFEKLMSENKNREIISGSNSDLVIFSNFDSTTEYEQYAQSQIDEYKRKNNLMGANGLFVRESSNEKLIPSEINYFPSEDYSFEINDNAEILITNRSTGEVTIKSKPCTYTSGPPICCPLRPSSTHHSPEKSNKKHWWQFWK